MTRRRFLAAVGTAGTGGVGGLAGCAGLRERTPGADLDATATASFRRGLRRHGRVDARVPGRVERAWRLPGVNVGDHTAAKSSPVPDGRGNLLVAGDTGELRSVTPAGGTNWVAATEPSARGVHATPAVANGEAYVGAYDGALYAFDVATGDRRWRTRLGDAIGGSPAYRDGRLYVTVEYAEPSGSLFAVDAATGGVVFEDDRIGDHPHTTPGVDLAGGTLTVGANDGYVYTWSFPSMAFAWRFDAGAPVKSPVAVHDGAAFFGSWDEAVFRVDLATGTADWRFDADGKVMCAPGVDPEAGVVYVGSHDSRVYALDAATGEERWRFDAGGWVTGSVTVADGRLLVGATDGVLYALDAGTGSEVWRVENRGDVTCEPLVNDGAVYYTERASPGRSGGLTRLVPAE